jgi:hypothetical protein
MVKGTKMTMTTFAEVMMSYEGALLAATGALSACVMFLFKRIDRQNQRYEKELEKCHSDREMLMERIIKLESRRCICGASSPNI